MGVGRLADSVRLQRVEMILETARTSLDNVLTMLTHLTRREDLAAYNGPVKCFSAFKTKSGASHISGILETSKRWLKVTMIDDGGVESAK